MRLSESQVIAETDVQDRRAACRQAGGAQRVDARMLRAGTESASIDESA
jgi:hypothetical protein